MSEVIQGLNKQEQRFHHSLFKALVGVCFIAMAVYLGAKDDFLATLLMHGGDFLEYAQVAGIGLLFIGGVTLVGLHLLHEGNGQDYCEQAPY